MTHGRSKVPGRISEAMQATARLRKAVKDANIAMGTHMVACYQCSQAVSITGDYCEDGWPIAIVRARALYNWNNRTQITARRPQTGTLFDTPDNGGAAPGGSITQR